ncbi:phage tail protein [Rossellomorea marisflavi]|uniref:phage tail protein n=1 Tax=Rossellomorea marisflavi TaxID=189381 RepID=UPI0039BF8B7E
MSEIYIFDRDDNLLSPITQSTGLISTWFKDHLNRVADEPFVFTVQADTEEARFVKEENQVAFRDKEGDYRLFVIKEIDDADGPEGPQTIATCFPAFMVELKKKFIIDRRFVEQVAQKALDATLEGTRWKGIVSVDLGTATTNFYHMLSVDAIWKILEVWGGDFKDIVKFNGNKIVSREVHIVQRLGTDNGHRFEIDHNVEEIARTVISNPVTALYGYGASLEIEDENGEATGGFTRFISFADVEWKVSNGDPVDKPKGQPWVGDPEALQRYGLLHEGRRLHLEDEFSNQEYEDPAELLQATWEYLQKVKDPEVNYRLSVWLLERLPGYDHERVSLGDTSRAIDRKFSRPIEIQARIIGLEYDIMDIESTAIAEMGQFLSVHDYDDRLDRAIETIRDIQGDLKTDKKVNEGSFPDIKPSVPANVQVDGAFQSIQLYWEFNAELFVKNYEVYGSQVKGFVPDAQHLLHRGTLNGFNHVVETDQVWYYRIRAVNYQGRASDYTAEYSGSTVRVMSEDILFGPELAAELRELSKVADILAPGSVDLENMKQEALDKINESAREYSQEEIQKVADEINHELADKAGLDYVDGNLLLKVDEKKHQIDIERLEANQSQARSDIAEIIEDMGDIRSQVDEDVERLTSVSDSLLAKVEENRQGLATNQGKIIAVEQNIDTINGSLSTAVRTLNELDHTVSEQRTLVEQQANQIRYLASQDSVDRLTGRVSSTEASLTILDGRISSKAEASSVFTKTEVNTALGKKIDSTVYNNKMSQLDVAISGIQANVRSVESEVSSVDSRLETTQSQLEIQAGLINAKAERNQVYSKTETDGRLTTEISKAMAEIKITTDGISTSVSKVSAKVDGFQAGGRNLLQDSAKEVTSSREFVRYADLAPIFDKYGVREYSISFDIKSADISKNNVMQVYMQNGSGAKYSFSQNVIVTDKFTRISITVTPKESNMSLSESWLSFFGRYDTGNIPTVKNVMVEIGNMPSGAWSPSPEDIDKQFMDVSSSISSIDQKADSIRSSVNTLTQTVNGHTSTISSINTSITQMDGRITGKAEKAEVVAVDGKINSVSSKVATLEIGVNGISTNVTQLDAKVNGISIGGNNLIPGTKDMGPQLGANGIDFTQRYGEFTVATVTAPSSGYVQAYNSWTPVLSGKEFVVSFYAKSTNAAQTITCYFYSPNTTTSSEASTGHKAAAPDGTAYVNVTNQWKRYWVKWSQSSDGVKKNLIVGRVSNGGNVSIAGVKFEKGNKDTDWTPATEDIDKQFTEVSSSVSAIDQKANSIQLSVTSLTQTVNGHTSSISSMNTSITQLNGKITSKAESSEVKTVNDRVTSVSNKVSTLEVSVNGISTSVSQLDSRIDEKVSSRGYGTDSTGASNANKWTKFMTSTIKSRYQQNLVTLLFNGGEDGSDRGKFAEVFVRHKQQNEMGGATIIEVSVNNAMNMSKDDFRAIVVTNNSQNVIVEFYVRIPSTYDRRYFTPFGIGAQGANNTLTFHNNQPFFYAPDLPSGVVFNGRDDGTNLGRIAKAETRIDQNATEISFKASQQSVNDLTGRMTKAESSLTVQSRQIEAKVDSDGVIAAINLQPGTVKIKGNLLDLIGDVYINNGRTYISTAAIKTAAIADAAITRAKLQTAIIGEAQIENGVITNAKIKDISADKMRVGTLMGISITSVTINSSVFTSSNGSNTTLIQGGYFESSGRYTRTWRGTRKSHQVDMRFENGYLRARNNTEGWSLYFMDSGISTYPDGSGTNEDASGTLAFRDTYYSDSGARGVTLHSYYGVVALRSEENRIFLDAKSSVNVESQAGAIYIKPMRDTRAGINEFRFAIKDNGSPSETDGWISYGSPNTEYAAGLRFQKTTSGRPTVYVTNGNGDIGTGVMDADIVTARSYFVGSIQTETDNLYAMVNSELRITSKSGYNNGSPAYRDLQARNLRAESLRTNGSSGQDFYIGVSSNELRITNNLFWNGGNTGYKPIRASDFIKSSSRRFKSNITKLEDIGIESVMSLEICRFELNTNIEEGKYDPKIGVIAEDSPAIVTRDGLGVEQDKLTYFNTKAIQELYQNQVKHDLRINDLELTVQYQKMRIDQLDKQVHQLQSAVA